ncbi:hypothetical protein PV646_19685 [Streptomyces sp. ID05-26A]|nr:hypothetical protein [Streptomyces sp. ID05-26A]
MLAVRTPCEASELDVLPSLTVHGLGDADARILLAAQSHETLVEQVRDRLMAEARGNPLALLVLTGAGWFAHPRTTSVAAQVEHEFETALAGFPEGARLLLTVAAADPTGDPTLLWSAAHELGIDMLTAGATATATGLVEFGTRVRFRHPLARAAAYGAAETTERLRARATAVPDDDMAAELERSASRAQSRGGVAAADLLATIEDPWLDEFKQAECDLLRGRIAFVRAGDSDGPTFMLRAAHRLAGRSCHAQDV